MCGTCGCTQEDGTITYTTFKDGRHYHMHGDGHDHHSHHDHHDHSHHQHQKTVVDIEADILGENKIQAARNRGYFEGRNILAFNLVSSPGSGKTALLEKSLESLKETTPIYVIEGDQQTNRDAERIAKTGVPVIQINTGNMCHLDADMIYQATRELNPPPESILFIENVGNLVCPALFDLGETRRVVVMSVTEGDDKPIKYPNMFHTANLCIINKIDLLPYVPFDVDQAIDFARQVNPGIEVIQVSTITGEGMDQWFDWVRQQNNVSENV